jgi:hypothetical protein
MNRMIYKFAYWLQGVSDVFVAWAEKRYINGE